MAEKHSAALRKRAQISRANRMMFVWVAGVSVIVGFALVVSVFLVQKLVFNEKVLAEKQATVSTLRHNNEVVTDLENEVRALESNQALLSARANDDDSALQVILDALPSSANSLALGASLQNRLLSEVEGVSIESLQVDPVYGVESSNDSSDIDASADGEGAENAISFRFTVTGSDEELQDLLKQLERSIRAIDITSMVIESQGNNQTMQVEARAFYEPAREITLKDKVVKP